MSKIKGLYRLYCQERNEELNEQITGGERMDNLRNFLKQKLNAEEYMHAEELLNDLLAETESNGFQAGCKYITELNHELLSK